MKFIKHALKEVFDFFCGDWRIFWGVAISIALIEAFHKVSALAGLIPYAGIIFVIGVSLSLVLALKREITH